MTAKETDQTTTTAEPRTTQSPDSAAAPRKSLSQLVQTRNPDSEAILAAIEDQTVAVASVESEQRQGKRRKYWMNTVTLVDGRAFEVAGKAIMQPFSYLTPADFPIDATFYREPSDFEPGASYWAVR